MGDSLSDYKEQLFEGMHKIGVELNPVQYKQFNQYYEMMIEKNKVMNLTAITEYEDVIMKHFVENGLYRLNTVCRITCNHG